MDKPHPFDLDHNDFVARYRITLNNGTFATQGQVKKAISAGVRAALPVLGTLPDADRRDRAKTRRQLRNAFVRGRLAFHAGETLGSLRRSAEHYVMRELFGL